MIKSVSIAALALACSSAFAISGLRPIGGDLTLSESITDLGGGFYDYSYTMTNVSAVNAVWWWGVYSATTGTGGGAGSLGGFYNGAPTGDMLDLGAPNVAWTYAASIYDPSIGIAVGSSGTMDFVAFGLDTSTKVFFADVCFEWAGDGSLAFNPDGTQQVSYYGTSTAVPEPASMAALGLGIAALIRRRKTR
ncbi:MAG: PEP-CTERM sorting domain-containing protein [Armatimonadetes bacterium]|nr:PEP-CTERM sorting domain-containing protein [Armatimonadota bacterium]